MGVVQQPIIDLGTNTSVCLKFNYLYQQYGHPSLDSSAANMNTPLHSNTIDYNMIIQREINMNPPLNDDINVEFCEQKQMEEIVNGAFDDDILADDDIHLQSLSSITLEIQSKTYENKNIGTYESDFVSIYLRKCFTSSNLISSRIHWHDLYKNDSELEQIVIWLYIQSSRLSSPQFAVQSLGCLVTFALFFNVLCCVFIRFKIIEIKMCENKQ